MKTIFLHRKLKKGKTTMRISSQYIITSHNILQNGSLPFELIVWRTHCLENKKNRKEGWLTSNIWTNNNASTICKRYSSTGAQYTKSTHFILHYFHTLLSFTFASHSHALLRNLHHKISTIHLTLLQHWNKLIFICITLANTYNIN